ncbi:MAG: hypothetical protein PHF00_08855 [Elusimicrobia bacterium]|nr:hypothetical protein [Elusimicrobiota bacterium]
MNLGKAPEEYGKLKETHRDEILLYQIGTFYKIMREDARKVAELAGLKLFVTGEAADPVPVCGFPQSGLDKYVGKLVRAGFAVAICSQVKSAEGTISREVREVIRCSRT